MNCPACQMEFPDDLVGIHCCPVLQNRPDTPEIDVALALATCIGALQAHDLPSEEASKALWRWRNARGMNNWPAVNGETAPTDDVHEAEVVG